MATDLGEEEGPKEEGREATYANSLSLSIWRQLLAAPLFAAAHRYMSQPSRAICCRRGTLLISTPIRATSLPACCRQRLWRMATSGAQAGARRASSSSPLRLSATSRAVIARRRGQNWSCYALNMLHLTRTLCCSTDRNLSITHPSPWPVYYTTRSGARCATRRAGDNGGHGRAPGAVTRRATEHIYITYSPCLASCPRHAASARCTLPTLLCATIGIYRRRSDGGCCEHSTP